MVSMASVAVGLVILTLMRAPAGLLVSLAAVLAILAIVTGITRYWKISGHTSVLTACITTLASVAVPWWLAAPMMLIAGWSRVYLNAHTLAQVAAGVMVGAVVGSGVYSMLE